MRTGPPPPFRPPLQLADRDDGPPQSHHQLWRITTAAVTVLATAWCMTLGWIPAILALMVAKHVLVALLVSGLQVDALPADDETPEESAG